MFGLISLINNYFLKINNFIIIFSFKQMKFFPNFVFVALLIQISFVKNNIDNEISWTMEDLYYHEDIRLIQAALKAKQAIITGDEGIKYQEFAFYFGRDKQSKNLFYKILIGKVMTKYNIEIYKVIVKLSDENKTNYEIVLNEKLDNFLSVSVNNNDYFRINKLISKYYFLNKYAYYYILNIKKVDNYYIIEPKLGNNKSEIVFAIYDQGYFFVSTTVNFNE